MSITELNFEIAAFDPSGVLLGTSRRRLCDLSEKWLAIAAAHLTLHGETFKSGWGEPLTHLVTQVTSSDGVALASFFANGVLVTSAALLCGVKSDAEMFVLKMFVDSLSKTDVVQENAINEIPFEDVFQLMTRPLIIVVPWGDHRVTEQDNELVQELVLHFGAAFFQINGGFNKNNRGRTTVSD